MIKYSNPSYQITENWSQLQYDTKNEQFLSSPCWGQLNKNIENLTWHVVDFNKMLKSSIFGPLTFEMRKCNEKNKQKAKWGNFFFPVSKCFVLSIWLICYNFSFNLQRFCFFYSNNVKNWKEWHIENRFNKCKNRGKMLHLTTIK